MRHYTSHGRVFLPANHERPDTESRRSWTEQALRGSSRRGSITAFEGIGEPESPALFEGRWVQVKADLAMECAAARGTRCTH